MRFGLVLRYIGIVLLLNSALMLIAASISYIHGIDDGFTPLVLSCVLTAILGLFPVIFVNKGERISSKESYIIVTGAWLLSCVVGTFPYILYGGDFNIINAWFESVSGFTATGATILTDIESLPKGLLFWRSSTQWIGAMGVVMFALTIVPSLGRSKLSLSTKEISIMAKDNFNYSTRKTINILLVVYLGMTVASAILLNIAGMDWFDSINHTFTTVSTGGFSTKNLSIGAFDNVWIEIIITVFTFLGGVHFGLIFATIIGKSNNMFRSEVFRYYFIITVVGATLITINLLTSGVYSSVGESVRHSFFQSVMIITTTGFTSVNSAMWTPFATAILFLFAMQCACAGSTSGGIKADRVLLVFKSIRARILQLQHPNAVIRIKLNGVAQEEGAVNYAILFIVVYFLFLFAGVLVNTLIGVDFLTSLVSSTICIGNVGAGFGNVCDLGNFAVLPDLSKLTSTILMLFGRLEIFGLIQLFIIKWWI